MFRQITKLFILNLAFLDNVWAVTDISLAGDWWYQTANLKPADIYLPSSKTHLQRDAWQKIIIPNNWYSAGLDFSGAVWHKKNFNLGDNLDTKQATLHFKAVDYAADVWLNGQYLGFHEGYFEPFNFDVTGLLKKQDNLLVVRVDSPYEPIEKVWSLKKRQIKGVLNHHDTRPAGAWSVNGQDANSGGIWQEVWLHFSDQLSIQHLTVEPVIKDAILTDKVDNLALQIQLQLSMAQPQALKAKITIEQINGKDNKPPINIDIDASQLLKVSENQYQISQSVLVNQLKTWWPQGYGESAVYRVKIDLFDEKNHLLDSMTQRFALRTIRYDDDQFAFYINGRRLFLRGTNYIASPWLGEVKRQDYQRDLVLMQQANINAVRVHAHIAGQDFYEIADELGMLVWQDFPLQWGYDDSPEFANEAVRQAKAMLTVLHHHPSIFAWSGHNEPPWNAPWMKYKYPDYKPQQNRYLTDAVGAVLASDKTRYSHDYSATDEHLWMGWYSGNWKEHAKRSKVTIVSEFGAQALPDVARLKKIIPASDLWPRTLDAKDPMWKSWDYHNFQVQETFKNAGISRGDSLESFVKNSQEYQAKLTQLAGESYRRQRYQPVAAMFQFMFNETWPSINWGVMDYTRQAKAGYWALKQAYQPVLASIEWDVDKLKTNDEARFVLWSINDTWQDYPSLKLRYRLLLANKVIKEGQKEINLMADEAHPEWELKWRGLSQGSYRLEAILSQQKKIISNNSFEFIVE